MSVGPLCGHGSCSQTHISFVTVLESRKNAQVFIKTSHFSQAGPHGGHNARSSGPYQRLLFHEPGIANRGQLWTGLWYTRHRTRPLSGS